MVQRGWGRAAGIVLVFEARGCSPQFHHPSRTRAGDRGGLCSVPCSPGALSASGVDPAPLHHPVARVPRVPATLWPREAGARPALPGLPGAFPWRWHLRAQPEREGFHGDAVSSTAQPEQEISAAMLEPGPSHPQRGRSRGSRGWHPSASHPAFGEGRWDAAGASLSRRWDWSSRQACSPSGWCRVSRPGCPGGDGSLSVPRCRGRRGGKSPYIRTLPVPLPAPRPPR